MVQGDWPLVGREEELEFVDRALGQPGAPGVVLAGAPGVGKTRLLLETLELAGSRGLPTKMAVATRCAASIPFGALAHLLPDDIRGGRGLPNLLRSVAAALVGDPREARLVLGIDDSHFLDETSAALVHHLAAAGSAFVVASVRMGDPAPDAVVGLWKEGLAERLELRPLARGEIEELVETVLGSQVDGATLHQLWEATRGNVLFLREIVLGGLETGILGRTDGMWRLRGPLTAVPGLVDAIRDRLGTLQPRELAALEILAVGEPLGLEVLESLSDPTVVESLERKGLLTIARSRRRFSVTASHPLYSEAIRVQAPAVRLRTIRKQLAEAQERGGARRREDLMRLVLWRLEAGLPARGDLLVAAANRALAAHDFLLAERLARTAVTAVGGFDAGQTLAEALEGLGRFEEAEEILEGLEGAATTEAQRVEIAMTRAGNLFWHLGRRSPAEEVTRRAETATSDRALRYELASLRLFFLLAEGRTQEAIEMATDLLERPGLSTRARLEAALGACEALNASGRVAETVQVVSATLPLAVKAADEHPHVDGHLEDYRSVAHVWSGRLSEAARGAERTYRHEVERGADWARGLRAWTLGCVARAQGLVRTSLRRLREAAALLRETDMLLHLPMCLGELAHSAALLGDVGAAEEALAEAQDVRARSFGIYEGPLMLGRAWTAVARGEISAGVDLALQAAEATGSMGQYAHQATALHDAARMGAASKVAATLQELSGRMNGRLAATFAAHAEALAANEGVRLDEMSREFEDLGAILLAAEAAAEAARAHRDAGQRTNSLACAARAGALAERCEGARTPALVEAFVPLPLTRREREVATLAARGLSNREIAERLVISVRTVDNHLHRTYSKLGLSGRKELRPILAPEPNPR